jgi:hypothetical protein
VIYDDAMTVEVCAAACSGFKFFGVEYRRECWCGNTLDAGSLPAPAEECKYACPADPTQSCGGDGRLNLFTYGSPTTPTPTPVPTGYYSEGCHTDNVAGRALTGAVFYDDALTVEKCSNICKGWAVFGVEYGRECYCGNAVQGGSTPAPEGECNFSCAGSLDETCGAGDRINLYRYGTRPVSSSTTTTTLSATVRIFSSFISF